MIEKYAGVGEIRSEFVDKIQNNINQKSEESKSKYTTYINTNSNLARCTKHCTDLPYLSKSGLHEAFKHHLTRVKASCEPVVFIRLINIITRFLPPAPLGLGRYTNHIVS